MKPVEEAVTGFASTDQAPGLSGQEGETQTHGSVSPRRGGRLSAGSSSPCRALPRSVPGPSSPAYPTTASRAPSRWSTVGCSVSMGLGFPPASPSCELEVESELTKVLIKVLFWALLKVLLLGKVLFKVLIKVLKIV